MFGLRKRVKELEKIAGELRWCCECGQAFKKREVCIGTIKTPWGVFRRHEEAKHCPDCDPIIKQRQKAEEIAKRCPDEVVKLANRKACKGE